MKLLLFIHIISALSSVALSSYSLFAPTIRKLQAAYALVAATLISGTLLIITTHVSILSGCLSGLLYVGVVLAGLVPARNKLARQTARQ